MPPLAFLHRRFSSISALSPNATALVPYSIAYVQRLTLLVMEKWQNRQSQQNINFEVLDCCVVLNNDEMIKVEKMKILIHSCVFFGLHCANRIVLKQGVRSQ